MENLNSSNEDKFTLPERFSEGTDGNVWVEYAQLAAKYQPINLGQGFPDFMSPEFTTKALIETARSTDVNLNQYARNFGKPRLVKALAKLYSRLIGRELDPFREIVVTSGAYEALFSTISGHISPGDEAIIIEPFFDCYVPMVKASGGKPVLIPLKTKKTSGTVKSSDWMLDKEELTSLFNKKTKLIIVNTPHNPLGKVFTLEELQFIADLCKKWNVLCISDEVYEWIVYKPNKHVRMASLPGMWERTVTIGSAGKTFSVTGWKTGWAYGPANLLRNVQVVHLHCVLMSVTPIQEALAIAFEKEFDRFESPDSYFNSLARELEPKRKMIVDFLTEAGMVAIVPDGGYFVMADWTPLESSVDLSQETDKLKDFKFTKWMTKNVGLQGIPLSAFYGLEHKHLGENYVRFCFIKRDESLKKAADILRLWKSQIA